MGFGQDDSAIETTSDWQYDYDRWPGPVDEHDGWQLLDRLQMRVQASRRTPTPNEFTLGDIQQVRRIGGYIELELLLGDSIRMSNTFWKTPHSVVTYLNNENTIVSAFTVLTAAQLFDPWSIRVIVKMLPGHEHNWALREIFDVPRF